MKVFGKEVEYKSWNYGVEWNAGGIRKIKHFKEHDDAKAFFDSKKRMLCAPIFFRFKPESNVKRAFNTSLVWRLKRANIKIKLGYILVAVLLVKLALLIWRKS